MVLYLVYFFQAIFIIRFHCELTSVMNEYLRPIYYLKMITSPIVNPIQNLVPWQLRKYVPLLIAFLIGILFLLVVNAPLKAKVFLSFQFFIESWVMVIQYSVVIYVILSWVRLPSTQQYSYLLDKLLSPILDPIRRVVPAFSGLDFSPLILMFGLPFVSGYLIHFLRQLIMLS